MPLPSSGTISLEAIRNEFGPSFQGVPVKISSYYRGGFYVRNTTANSKIPTTGQIKFSDFYGGVKYSGSATILVVSEGQSTYQDANNGSVQVTVFGTSPSFTVSCTGRTPVNLVNTQSTTFGSYDSSSQVTITITDNAGTRSFGPYTIGYDSGAQTYNVNL